MQRLHSILSICLLSALGPDCRPAEGSDPAVPGITHTEFEELMKEVATGWNEGDARRAANCFTEDAVYSEPPAKQLFRSRQALFEFFGGEQGRSLPMSMAWHHLAFNTETGVGMGEFTFVLGDGDPSHGVIVVRIENGKIANWREYYYETELDWEEFTAANPF